MTGNTRRAMCRSIKRYEKMLTWRCLRFPIRTSWIPVDPRFSRISCSPAKATASPPHIHPVSSIIFNSSPSYSACPVDYCAEQVSCLISPEAPPEEIQFLQQMVHLLPTFLAFHVLQCYQVCAVRELIQCIAGLLTSKAMCPLYKN